MTAVVIYVSTQYIVNMPFAVKDADWFLLLHIEACSISSGTVARFGNIYLHKDKKTKQKQKDYVLRLKDVLEKWLFQLFSADSLQDCHLMVEWSKSRLYESPYGKLLFLHFVYYRQDTCSLHGHKVSMFICSQRLERYQTKKTTLHRVPQHLVVQYLAQSHPSTALKKSLLVAALFSKLSSFWNP